MALFAALASLLLVAGCAHAGYSVESVVYTPAGWPALLEADMYVPAQPGPRAAVLVIHGGGWERRDRHDMDGIARRLADRGFVVMNAGYRFAPAWRFPAQLQDLQQALHWLRASAPRYGVDPGRVGVFGYSAGGHLAALLGTAQAGEPVQAVVAGGAPFDLRKFEGGRLVPQLLGATFAERPDLFAAASPVTHVSPGDSPMFIYHGAGDTLVPPSHATDMKRALDVAGVPNELRLVPVLGHVLTFLLARGTEDEAMDFLERKLAPR